MSWRLPLHSRIVLASAFALSTVVAVPARADPPKQTLGDIKGESMDDKHKDTIELARCNTQNVVPSSDPEEGGRVTSAARKGSGKVQVHDMNVVKSTDKASPALTQGSAQGSCQH